MSSLTTTFGNTPTGGDWCLKALHPSDPLTEVRGIPDHSAVPSVLMNYQSTLTISHPTGTTPWEFRATLLPHPINFMFWETENPTAADSGTFLNPQIDGTTHAEKYTNFKKLAQRWRLAYCGVTCYQDGPDLANQGTIVVAQPAVQMKRRYASMPNLTGVTSRVYAGVPICRASEEDLPDFTTSQSMPNAYFNRSREGAYVPLKLTESCQDWISETNDVAFGLTTKNTVGNISGDCFEYVKPGPYSSELYPHYAQGVNDLVPVYMAPGLDFSDPVLAGEVTSEFMNGTFAHICAQNLDPATSFTLYFRYGIEMQVSPGSTISPQMKLSPPYDAAALNTYFSIARELKDAYPASYNDLGKLWDVVSKAAKKVLPMLGSFGPVGTAAEYAGNVALNIGDRVRNRRKQGKKAKPVRTVIRALASVPPPTAPRNGRDKMSAAEIEAYQSANRVAQALRGAMKRT